MLFYCEILMLLLACLNEPNPVGSSQAEQMPVDRRFSFLVYSPALLPLQNQSSFSKRSLAHP
jgi:hypothetical protein